jgi:cytochrome c553
MRKWLRRLGIALGAVVGLIVLALLGVFVATELRMRKTYDVPAAALRLSIRDDDALQERGRHIAVAVGKCVDCHAGDLGGKLMSDDPIFGRLAAANLTKGRGGIGGYSNADYVRALRHGVGREGKPLIFMPSEVFMFFSDEDLSALIAYLKSIPPVDRELPPTRVGPLGRILFLAGAIPLVPAELIEHDAPPPPAPAPGVTTEYGEYLSTVGGCKGCHGPDLAGTGAPGAVNITPAKLGTWSEADFFRALRQGKRPDGTEISRDMPWPLAGQMTDEEIRAVWMYLRSVPPVVPKS